MVKLKYKLYSQMPEAEKRKFLSAMKAGEREKGARGNPKPYALEVPGEKIEFEPGFEELLIATANEKGKEFFVGLAKFHNPITYLPESRKGRFIYQNKLYVWPEFRKSVSREGKPISKKIVLEMDRVIAAHGYPGAEAALWPRARGLYRRLSQEGEHDLGEHTAKYTLHEQPFGGTPRLRVHYRKKGK